MSREIYENIINQQGAVPCSFECVGNTIDLHYRSIHVHMPQIVHCWGTILWQSFPASLIIYFSVIPITFFSLLWNMQKSF